MRLEDLTALESPAAVGELLRCCGSTRWAQAMAAARPFDTIDAACDRSDAICASLERPDWLEAFAAHPRIGDDGTDGRSSASERWSADEQSGVRPESKARFHALNRDYEQRFGHVFIICATGKTGDEMLRALERRMRNNPGDELKEAADEQRTIARLRLVKLLT